MDACLQSWVYTVSPQARSDARYFSAAVRVNGVTQLHEKEVPLRHSRDLQVVTTHVTGLRF